MTLYRNTETFLYGSMIFTHIFRYLDDRDAAEESRRSDNTNTSSSAINSRFPEPSWEQRDFRFKQISLKPATAAHVSVHSSRSDPALAQGFCTLRAKPRPRPTPKQRVLPPIRAPQIREEKQLTANEQKAAKLPTIERFDSGSQPVAAREIRSRSKKNKEAILRSGAGVQNSTQTNQPWLFLCPLRVGECEELCNSDGSVMTAINAADNLSDHLLPGENESPADKKEPEENKSGSSHDEFEAKATLMRKFYYQGLQKGTKQEVFEALEGDESTQIEAINAEQAGNSTASGQMSGKKWAARKGQRVRTNTEGKDFQKGLGLGERERSSFSEARDNASGKLGCRGGNTPNTECLHFAEFNENFNGSLATLKSAKEENDEEFNVNDCERRNAICEVIEKTAVPDYGLCLYEMRQNLIHLLEDQRGLPRRNTRSNKNSTLWRLCHI